METRKALISDIFDNASLVGIPLLQRPYVWNEDLWSKFLEDMENVSLTGEKHSLGSIILRECEKALSIDDCSRMIVIDGQQRITTFLIFLKVLSLKLGQNMSFDFQYSFAGDDDKAFKRVMDSVTANKVTDLVPEPRIISAYNYFIDHIDETKLNINTILTNVVFEITDLNKYDLGLQTQRDRIKADDAAANIKKFYRENLGICKRAYEYFTCVRDNANYYRLEPRNIEAVDYCQLLPEKKILVITVNPIEKFVFLHWLYDQNGTALKSYMVGDITLTNYAVNDNAMIIHVNALRTGEDATRVVLNQIRKIFVPSYVFMLGICYGLNMKKHSIGSVFISDSLSTFRLNFRDRIDSDETIFEAEEEYDVLPNRSLICKISNYYSYRTVNSVVNEEENPTIVQLEIGRFLSSNSLVSSRKVKQAVLDQYANRKPKPLGGEMEAAGILKSYLVEEEKFNDWLIIKSVCDWGEKKNSLDPDPSKNEQIKDSLQAFAMTNTCGAFQDILKYL